MGTQIYLCARVVLYCRFIDQRSWWIGTPGLRLAESRAKTIIMKEKIDFGVHAGFPSKRFPVIGLTLGREAHFIHM
jgi:hypothetical protein